MTASSATLSGSIDSHLDGTKSGAGADDDLLTSRDFVELEDSHNKIGEIWRTGRDSQWS